MNAVTKKSTLLPGQPASVSGSQSLDEILPAIDSVVLQILLSGVSARYSRDIILEIRVAEVSSSYERSVPASRGLTAKARYGYR